MLMKKRPNKSKIFFLIFFICFPYVLKAQDYSLLVQLDKAIDEHAKYVEQKYKVIDNIKNNLKEIASNSIEEYNLNTTLYSEYRAFICDSAIRYLDRNIEIAIILENKEKEYKSKLDLAYLMGSTGMYKEAVDLLTSIKRNKLPLALLRDYYNTFDRVYSELAFYTQDIRSKQIYWDISQNNRDSLMAILKPEDDLYLILKETEFRNAWNFTEANKINEIRLQSAQQGTAKYALITYHRALSSAWEGNRDAEKHYLALSALSDIMSATKDHASLWMLALKLYEDGDIERAYKYIRFSWDETVFYNARLRTLQSSSILSIIDKTYQAVIEKQNKQLQIYLISISALFISLAFALFFIYRQMKRLTIVQKNLKNANGQLKKLNEELKIVNTKLQTTNIALSESNHIKEEYIGRFIKLCSTYIDKLDGFRRMVNKKIASSKTEELYNMLRSQDILDSEFEELYAHFDTAFLRLFPDFVDKVNELLQEDEKIILKKDELLNTELRILALIRLGINDSSQIADFLRYSINTIYNYRSKVKNRAIAREDLESLIMNIH